MLSGLRKLRTGVVWCVLSPSLSLETQRVLTLFLRWVAFVQRDEVLVLKVKADPTWVKGQPRRIVLEEAETRRFEEVRLRFFSRFAFREKREATN